MNAASLVDAEGDADAPGDGFVAHARAAHATKVVMMVVLSAFI
jgi:hypothetical protein